MPNLGEYLALIPPQNRERPRFTATVSALVEPLAGVQDFIAGLPRDFDLDVAIGAQLDVVGEWVGRSRFVPLPLPGLFFSFDIENRGFDVGIWKGPYDSESGITRLDDDTYRMLLRAKIAANNWDGTLSGARAALDTIFTDQQSLLFIQDNGDMSVTFGVSGRIPSPLFLALLAGGYLPLKPEGVQAFYSITSIDGEALFGFDVENEYVAGFDAGAFGVHPSYFTT